MSSFRRRRRKEGGMPEVSLTPLIDTALVLLVIFMVSTPMMQNSLNVDLPTGQMNEGATLSDNSLVVTIDAHNVLYFQKKPMNLDELCKELGRLVKESRDNKVYVNCDKNVSSGLLIKVIDSMKYIAGVEHVVLPTEKS